jgi:Fe-S-cluster containining protein
VIDGNEGFPMDFDFAPYFKRYEAVVTAAEKAFAQMTAQYPDAVRCGLGCADCCYALFDLTFVEALYINKQFYRSMEGLQREVLLDRANTADRQTHKIKRQAADQIKNGVDEQQVLEAVARQRVRCPLLNAGNTCDLYSFRPITCRLYGIPTAIHGQGHTCGRSGFEPGKSYPTVKLEVLNQKLLALSSDLVAALGSRHTGLADLMMPLSMALLADFDDEYLGVKKLDSNPTPPPQGA